jgi:hypothetical protein
MPRSLHRRSTGRRLIGLAVLVLIAATLVAFPRLQITYHRWQLERGRDYMLGLDRCWGTGEFLWTVEFDDGVDESWAVTNFNRFMRFGWIATQTRHAAHFGHHLDRLVRFGQIQHAQYQLKYLEVNTPEGDDLLRTLSHLPAIHWWISPFWADGQKVILEVWMEPSDAWAWDEFIAERDVPDYRAKFLQDGG